MSMQSTTERDSQIPRLLDDLAPRLQTPKSELIAEIEARLTGILGLEVEEVFRAVAERQHHTASSLNLDRAHKSALVLIAHALAKVENERRTKIGTP